MSILAFRELASGFNIREQIAQAASITFGGLRNLWAAFGYQDKLGVQDYRRRYARGGIAARVVDAYPEETWKGEGDLFEVEDPDKVTPFEEAWFELSERLKIWPLFKRADTLSGLGRYGAILIGAPGALNAELGRLSGDNLFFFQPYAEDRLLVEELEKDILNERYAMPLRYKLIADKSMAGSADADVHWTRVVHLGEGLLDDNIYGQPRLQRVWNYIDDLEKVSGGGAEAFWLRAHQGFQLNIDPSVPSNVGAEERLKEEAEKFVHGMQRFFRTRGVKVETLGSDVADFSRPVASVIALISAATGIPQRILLGSERGELASTQDRSNWADRINNRRSEYAGPFIVRALVDRLIEHGALPEPDQYDIRWPSHEPSDDERASLAVKLAQVNQQNGTVVFSADEIRDRTFGLEPLSPEVIRGEVEQNTQEEDREDGQASPEEGAETEGAAGARAARQDVSRLIVGRVRGSALDKRRRWWRRRRRRS
jgi:uncharacterized protein